VASPSRFPRTTRVSRQKVHKRNSFRHIETLKSISRCEGAIRHGWAVKVNFTPVILTRRPPRGTVKLRRNAAAAVDDEDEDDGDVLFVRQAKLLVSRLPLGEEGEKRICKKCLPRLQRGFSYETRHDDDERKSENCLAATPSS